LTREDDYDAVIAITFRKHFMATMTIRNLDDDVKARLRMRAARHGRSMEEEARSILRAALTTGEQASTGAALVRAIRARAARLGGIDLELPEREAMREPPDFSGPGYDA